MIDKMVGAGIGDIAEIKGGAKTNGSAKAGSSEKSFGEFLADSLQQVNQLQKEADSAVKQMAAGKDGASLQEAMVAVEKADVAFKLMMEVRSKILDAYQEIMRMQV